ncbi:MAG: C25 family cysteine peptidase [Bacteroidales bacterium]|nr:C25 family cysteine peptidase [Bacteroidales bacterium]
MKYKIGFLTFITLIFSVMSVYSQNLSGTNSVELELTRSNETILKFSIGNYDFKTVQTTKGEAIELIAPETSAILKKGAPELPKQTVALAISESNEMEAEIVSSKFIEVKNVLVAPSKGVLSRTVQPKDVPYTYGKEYRKNKFYPSQLVSLNDPYIIRDVRGQSVVVNPFQYNPATKVLRIYTEISVRIKETNKRGTNAIMRTEAAQRPVDGEFNKIYSNHFINYNSNTRKSLSDGFGRMLIVCHGPFMGTMKEFVDWKRSIGYTVDLVDYSKIGNASALQKYVKNYYNSKGLTYLLLVGDHQQVPAMKPSSGYSDNNYGYIVGNDHYLDIFVGRFSAEKVDHVKTQVQRSLYYERDLPSTSSWIRKGVGIASNEGSGESDEDHMNYIQKDLEKYGYSINKCYQNGGNAGQLTKYLNEGRGIINYVGHGSPTSWSSMYYSSNHVNKLQNTKKLPFIVSVACVVGQFYNKTSFCEVWQRATHNGQPAGAVVNAGSTINQSWRSPMTAQDEMTDLMIANKVRTFGGMFANGMFKMIDKHGKDGEKMADTWTCFGDPSIQLRTPGNPNGPNSTGGQAPTITITKPGNGDNFPKGSNIAIAATASDKDGKVTQVEFFSNGKSIGVDKTAPYTATITNAAKGSYTITAVAMDNDNLKNEDEIKVTVGTVSEIVEVTDVITDCNKKGKARNHVLFTVTKAHSSVTATPGKLINLGSGKYKIRHVGIAFGSTTKYKITVKDGSTTAGTKTVTVKAVTSCNGTKEYTISASASANGKISPSGNVVVKQGANQTFTITASAGYKISDVKVDNSSIGATSSYTFSNVTANHSIAATFVKSTTTSPIKVTNIVKDCNKAGKPRIILFVTVQEKHTSLTSNRGTVINDGNSNYRIRDIGLKKGGTYTYKLTAKNGGATIGTATEVVKAVTTCPKSAEPVEHENYSFAIAPNPANEYVNLKLTGYSNATIKVINMNGSVVIEQNQTDNETILNTTELSAGIYIIQVADSKNTDIQRLVIE